jgi:DNA-binding NarL/FixJ family response regulator
MSKCITVSLVDDELDLREHIAGFVGAAPGFRCVSTYASAEEALRHLPKDKPDVVLMDINLGGLSGIECVRQLKPLAPATQIVMLTVFDDTEKIFSALAAGASGYLLKRLAPAKLLEAIREVHEGGSPMSAPIARKLVQSLQSTPARGDENADLSPREREVLHGLAEGQAYKQIADKLGVSIHTVRNYIRRIYEKLHVRSRTEAVAKFLRH